MIPRRQLRHHATIFSMHLDLAVEQMSQQAGVAVIDCDTGFIAGCFNPQNSHKFRISSTVQSRSAP